MSSTVSGVLWKANYGEISEKAHFRVGKVESDTWEASFPIAELSDLISVLQDVTPLPVGTVQRGVSNQARKIYAGFFTDVIIEPRLDTGTPSEILRFGDVELSDFLYVLQLLATDLANKYPDDWDFSSPDVVMAFDRFGRVTSDEAAQYLSQLIDATVDSAVDEASKDSIQVISGGVSFAKFPGTLRGTRRYNASSFTQDPIQTAADGTQFAVWIDSLSRAIVGKRERGSSVWETFDLTNAASNVFALPVTDDSHNSFSMVVDGAGYIHLSGNHHLNPLRYARSVRPLDITAWTAPGMIGDAPEATMTYPQFVKLPDGNLIFTFRDEGPVGLGAYYMNHYDAATMTWTRRGKLLDGTTVTPAQSPYLNKLAVANDGTLHLFFLWRGSSNDPRDSTQISHMKSSDSGVTWKTAAGAALALPVLYSNAAPVITQTLVGELNQSGAAVDDAGNPWSVWWRSLGTLNGGWGIYVRRWDGSAWVQEYLLNTGDRRWTGVDISLYPRPQLFAWQGRMFLLYVRELDASGLRLREVTPGAANPLPDTMIFAGSLGRYEPVFDLSAIASTSELHVLVTPTQEGTASANPTYVSVWGGVLTVNLPSIVPKPVPRETVLIAPSQMVPAASPAVGTIEVINATPAAKIMDDAQTTEFVSQTQIPVGWSSFRMKVLWMPLAAAPSGNLMLRANIRWNIPGELAGSGESIQFGVAAAAGAQYKVVESSFDMVINRPPGDSWLLTLTVNRWGGQGSDTLTGGVGILGIILTRSS